MGKLPRLREVKHWICADCKYDLRGTLSLVEDDSINCPECGRHWEIAELRSRLLEKKRSPWKCVWWIGVLTPTWITLIIVALQYLTTPLYNIQLHSDGVLKATLPLLMGMSAIFTWRFHTLWVRLLLIFPMAILLWLLNVIVFLVLLLPLVVIDHLLGR